MRIHHRDNPHKFIAQVGPERDHRRDSFPSYRIVCILPLRTRMIAPWTELTHPDRK